MTLLHELADDKNCSVLDENLGTIGISPNCKAIVSVGEISLPVLYSLWRDFQEELRNFLRDTFSKTADEFKEWHISTDVYDFTSDPFTGDGCVGFKATEKGHGQLPMLMWLRLPAVFNSLKQLNLTSTVGKFGRKRAGTAAGVTQECKALTIDQQRLLLAHLFGDKTISLDKIIKFNQKDLIDTESIELFLKSASDTNIFFDRLASSLYEFFTPSEFRPTGTTTARGDGRHFAGAWFCAYLVREGYMLLPHLGSIAQIAPRLLKPMGWTFFVPSHSRALTKHIVGFHNQTNWDWLLPSLWQLMVCTNFFRATSFDLSCLKYLKSQYSTSATAYSAPLTQLAQINHGLNKVFDAYLFFNKKKWEDIGDEARYFGGGKQIAVDYSEEAFCWVDYPERYRLHLYRQILGEPPIQFSELIQDWAKKLRDIIALFKVATPIGKITSLNWWLLYLIEIGSDAASSWEAIDREKHINDVGLGTHTTFLKFLDKNQHKDPRTIPDLQKAWRLASIRDGFASKLSNPIDVRFDRIAWQTVSSGGRTRRKSVPETIFDVIVEENRRDDFAFARTALVSAGPNAGKPIHWRQVVDPETSTKVDVFWPAMPMILDILFTAGTRFSTADWMDSGEGDAFWVDPKSNEQYPNPLASRTTGRADGFLRVCYIGINKTDKVLGMYMAKTKTGPYEVPWIDPLTAGYFVQMRDWQVTYNPLRRPIQSNRCDVDKKYADKGLIPLVYPLFRDPLSRVAHPPTSETVHKYWTALLRHCEPLVENNLGYFEPLLINGKPRYDLHSLRVTRISTLLENGVPPWIVQELSGHKSVPMLWHYKDIDSFKTHAVLQGAYEKRRKHAIEQLQILASKTDDDSDDDTEVEISKIVGGLIKLREDNVGASLFHDAKSLPDGYEIFSHGICPGGDCDTGGPFLKNVHKRVFRPRACSRCRYRITGPAFLPGLIHRMNILMVEIKASLDKEDDLNAQIETAEVENGANTGRVLVLRGLVSRERELRDELYAEWCAEMSTVKTAEGLADRADGNSQLPVVTGLTQKDARLQLDSVHQLSLIHTVLADGNLILGASLEIPDGLRQRRDAILLEIARCNNLTDFFWTLDPVRRRRALNSFGDVLLDHVRDSGKLQCVIEGKLPVSSFPALQMDIEEFIEETHVKDPANAVDFTTTNLLRIE